MPEQIYKLSPHRDLQCYFLTPSAVAAMSQANESGFVLSGSWRQQFDWAVVEWNRDNVFEHPALRCLPDGDLSGLTLTYQEQRTGCILFESNLYPVVDWNNIRIWAPSISGLPNTAGVTETVYHVSLSKPLISVTSLNGYTPASATMTLVPSSLAAGEQVGLAWLNEFYFYTLVGGEDLPTIAKGLTANINDAHSGSQTFSASWVSTSPNSVTVTWHPHTASASYQNLLGANGNRLGMYGFASRNLKVWQNPSAVFSGGTFPSTYQVTLNFGSLAGYYQYYDGSGQSRTQPVTQIPTSQVRKIRWTWAADLQAASFERTPFQVSISNWTVTGAKRSYSVAGPGSRRIEDIDNAVTYSGTWTQSTGNYSGSTIHATGASGASCSISYNETASHELLLGTRLLSLGAAVSVSIDGRPASTINLAFGGEDILIRSPLGTLGPGTHTVSFTQTSADPTQFWFDFLEIAYPSANLPDFPPQPQLALATDWDTYHSQSLPAERTAWLINKLGLIGRVDHYVGALWFYELVRTGTQYASASVQVSRVSSAPAQSIAELLIDSTPIDHSLLPNDTPETLAQAFALLINNGSNSIWASASGATLTITARAMGKAGNGINISLGVNNVALGLTGAPIQLSGGVDGTSLHLDPNDSLQSALMAATQGWCTDLTAVPRINRAAWDWHVSFFRALKGYGMEAVAAFSTELGNGDPSDLVGIAQRYWDGTPVVVNTPAVQTNFSPAALNYWTQVYLDMATIQAQAGMVPYLQAGEVQWWYFPKKIWIAAQKQYVEAMTFYDAYTEQQFSSKYGISMQLIQSTDTPNQHPNETAFLPTLIGAYTAAIRNALRTQYPGCRYEVLYPNDVNNTPLNQAVNFPAGDWTPANLNCLKTESFGFTGSYNLDQSTYSMNMSSAKGFPNPKRSHLVGISDVSSSWMKEVDIAQSQGLESVVLWALDQYCLIGYPAPPFVKLVRSGRQG